MISALVPSLTIYRANLRSRSLEATDVAHEKKKKRKKERERTMVHAQSSEYYLVHFVWSLPKNWTGPPLFVHGKERVHQRETGCYPFLLFSTSLQITRRTFAQRFACPRGRPHLIRMNGLARLTHSSNPPRFTRFRAKPSVFVIADQKIK